MRKLGALWTLLLVTLLASPVLRAQPAASPQGSGGEEVAKAADPPLAGEQRQVADRFRELEKLLLRMAELTAPTDPRRAALLRQAVAQSKQRDIEHQFDTLVELLRQQRLASVVKSQAEVHDDLRKLLELLLSEDRSKRIESEKERIRNYLKQVNKLIKDQKSIQGETNRGADEKPLAEKQGKLADKTGELAEEIKEAQASKSPSASEAQPPADPKPAKPGSEQDGKDAAEGKDGEPQDSEKKDNKKDDADKPDSDQKGGDKKDGDKKDTDKKDGESKDAKPDGESKDSDGKSEDSKSGEAKPGEKSQPQPGSDVPPPPGDSQPSEGGGESSPPQEQNPAQQRLEQAQKRMQEAQKKLEEAKREDAADKQAEAIKELEQAKADLEEILRQLREEEMSRTLAALEARFRKMLAMQIEVLEGTERLDKVPEADRGRDQQIESGRWSRKQAQIMAEADKALVVLREEGSAVAFPEAVEGMRDDMHQVVERLAQFKLGEVTLGLEADIVAALEEMIAALQKAQKDQEQKQQQGQPPQQGEGEEQPLVDTLSELKMIRALQMRVNLRTERYAKLTQTEQAERPDLLIALKQLAERQQRIHKVTRDIVVGRNR